MALYAIVLREQLETSIAGVFLAEHVESSRLLMTSSKKIDSRDRAVAEIKFALHSRSARCFDQLQMTAIWRTLA